MAATKETPENNQNTGYEALVLENTEIKKQLDSQQAELAELRLQNEQIQKLFENSQPEQKGNAQKASVKEKPTIPDKAVFSVEKKKYRIVLPHVNIPGLGYRTATEILLDKDAQEKLVSIGSGAIREEL